MAEVIREHWWALVFLGIFVGAFAGLFGLGGGVIMVPLMVLLLGFGQREAQATSLAMILSPFAAPGIYNWHRSGYIEWKIVWFMAPSLLVGSFLGSMAGKALPQDIMKLIFALVLAYIAAYMVFSKISMVMGFVYSLAPVVLILLLAWPLGVFRVVARTSAQAVESETSIAQLPVESPGDAVGDVTVE